MTGSDAAPTPGLARRLGLMGLVATGVCSMLGMGINVVPFMLQRTVPGIGPWVLPAYLFAAVPAVLAALAYATLASAMPRAGGSYVYASRGLSPYLGFVASFSHWFGLSIAIGVVSYVLIPFVRDIVAAIGWVGGAELLELGVVRVGLALVLLWASVGVNLLGLDLYQKVLIPLMVLMFVLGATAIVAGFSFDQVDFAVGLALREGVTVPHPEAVPFQWPPFLAASTVLFSSFIGFDSIAQAGGEARDPQRTLPLAIAIAVITVGAFYFLFTAATYHTVPWPWIAERAQVQDLTAPGMLGYVLSPSWTVLIVAGGTVALINDLPAMLLAVSRLMFAWAEDGVFPRRVAAVHPRYRTPHTAIVVSGCVATASILGSHFAGDFFIGVDILVTSMLVNFLVMCLALLYLPVRNPRLAAEVAVIRSRPWQVFIGGAGCVLLTVFLAVHIWTDLTVDVPAWYYRSTPLWLMVMAGASVYFIRELSKLTRSGVDTGELFGKLPPE